MNFDDWVPMAAARLREAAREVEKRPELKNEFINFLFDLERGARDGDIRFTRYVLEESNPVADVVSFDDLSNTLGDAYWGSHIKQRDRFSCGRWVKDVERKLM